MANVFSFKESKTTTMKMIGFVDAENMRVIIDGEIKDISTLLSPFSGLEAEITVKVKEEEEFDEPISKSE